MPNSPSASRSSVWKVISGLGGEDQVLAAGVLEQVGAQLFDHLLLDALVAFAVLGREPDRVLVGHVHARDRHGAVGVHLAGELAREFHRAHLRAEDAPEGALDEVGDRGLDALEQVHRRTARAERRTVGRGPSAMLRTLTVRRGPRSARAATATSAAEDGPEHGAPRRMRVARPRPARPRVERAARRRRARPTRRSRRRRRAGRCGRGRATAAPAAPRPTAARRAARRA